MKIMNYLKSIISILLFFFAGCSLSAGAPATPIMFSSNTYLASSLGLTTNVVSTYENYCKGERKKIVDILLCIRQLLILEMQTDSSNRIEDMFSIIDEFLKPGAKREISLSREFRDGAVRAVVVPISNIIKEKEQNSKPQHTHHTDTQNAKDIRDIRADFNRFEEEPILGKKFTLMVQLIKDLQDTPGNGELQRRLLTQFEILRKAAETEADSDAQQTIYTKFQATDDYKDFKETNPGMLPRPFESSMQDYIFQCISPIFHYFIPSSAKWNDYIRFLIEYAENTKIVQEFLYDYLTLSQLTDGVQLYDQMKLMYHRYTHIILKIPISFNMRRLIEDRICDLDELENPAKVTRAYIDVFEIANIAVLKYQWDDSFRSVYSKYIEQKNWC